MKRILIAPLDWGLGHTTRCIPLIRHLTGAGHQVMVAGNEAQHSLLRPLFPQLTLLPLEGYAVTYGRTGAAFRWQLLKQLPRLTGAIRKEHRWLQHLATVRQIDGVISDNRYGLYHEQIPSAILTHQAQVLTGMGSLADGLARRAHYRLLRRFGKCWIVDVPGKPNLGGRLSHPEPLPPDADYLGLLSQLQPSGSVLSRPEGYLMVLLSGPEPQRTLLSQLLWPQMAAYAGKVVFVEGSAGAAVPESVPDHIRHYRRLTAIELQPLLEGASMVICRSGYSTLMDLCLLRKGAILIPTPGQTEQEYLGRHLREQGVHLCYAQEGFSLTAALDAAGSFPFHPLLSPDSHRQFIPVLDQWVHAL